MKLSTGQVRAPDSRSSSFLFKSGVGIFVWLGFLVGFGLVFLKKMKYRLYCNIVFLRKMPCQFNLDLLLGLLF